MSKRMRVAPALFGGISTAVFGIVGLLILGLLSSLILILWSDHIAIGNVVWQAMVVVHAGWIAIATALIALVALPHRRTRSARGTVFRTAACMSLLSFAILAGAAFSQANIPYRPLNTEADVRPRLETLLKQRVRGFPQFARIGNLDEQIKNVRISGPSMTFEPETTRHVTFDLDTGCGKVIEVSAVLDAGDADILGSVERNSCRP